MRVEIDTYHDHRIAMSFGVLGSRLPGLRIIDPGCVAKTYPNYWQDWQRARRATTQSTEAGSVPVLITSAHAFARHRSRSPVAVFPGGRRRGVRTGPAHRARASTAARPRLFPGSRSPRQRPFRSRHRGLHASRHASHDADIQFALGSLMRKRGEVDRAIAIHMELAQHREAPIRERATLALGLDYLSAGLLDRAEEKLRNLMGSATYRAAVLEKLAWVYEQQRDWRAALDIWRELTPELQRERALGRGALLLRARRSGARGGRHRHGACPGRRRARARPRGSRGAILAARVAAAAEKSTKPSICTPRRSRVHAPCTTRSCPRRARRWAPRGRARGPARRAAAARRQRGARVGAVSLRPVRGRKHHLALALPELPQLRLLAERA